MNRETWKGDIKINLQKWYKNVHQGQGPAVVFGNCGNKHPEKEREREREREREKGRKKKEKLKKNTLTQTGDYISYITTTFQPLYEGKQIIIYTIYKGKDTKKYLPCVCQSHKSHKHASCMTKLGA